MKKAGGIVVWKRGVLGTDEGVEGSVSETRRKEKLGLQSWDVQRAQETNPQKTIFIMCLIMEHHKLQPDLILYLSPDLFSGGLH